MKHDWEYKKLGDYIKEYSVKNKDNKPIPVYSVTNSQGFCKEYFNKEVASKNKTTYKIVPYGFFAYNPSRINVGSIDWQHIEDNVIVSPLYNVFSVKKEIRQDYLLYFLKSSNTMAYINVLATGTVRSNLKLSMLKEFTIPVPALAVQERIVGELDKVSEIIEKKKQQVKELDNLAQSIFYDMFGDPVENEKGWEVRRLGEIGSLARGISKHRPRNAPELLGGTMPLIQTGDVSNSGMYITEYHSTYSEIGVRQSRAWQSGTLCITIAANIGKCSILTFEACFPDSVVGFIPKERICIEYMYFVFGAIQKTLEDNAMGVAQKNINLGILNQLLIAVPPLPLQQSFAQKIEAIEKQKELINQSIKEVQTLFDARMDYWFGE